ncbi:phage antirepressor KilAC domain-containing protein [uncultured Clostridium sp.]|uniref:phage antirepressor KilAC domain-containing protein n=1 Tax=uncultured Clostridium sp. TaxID=59620 RepID=UPI0025E66166|nr:phage antirepressor KilAC domain-containing protein [uncultured Clostridium sp.]
MHADIESCENKLVREVAKSASRYGIIIGEKKLWNILREWGFIFKNSTEPKQCGINRGFFVVINGVAQNGKYTFPFKTTRVTPKGQEYIINRILNDEKS